EKLLQLRKAREERKNTPPTPTESNEKSKKDELDALLADLLPKQEPKIEAPEKPVEKEPTLPPDSIKIDNLPPNFITSSGPATPTITTRFVPDFTTFEAVILDIPPK
ncbi:11478_t:CDS:2, partial [Ambispora leptoticha]